MKVESFAAALGQLSTFIFPLYTFHQAVMQKMLNKPASPLMKGYRL